MHALSTVMVEFITIFKYEETGSYRHSLHAGSAAGGVAELDSMRYNYDGKAIARAVEKEARKVGETLAEDEESDSSE